MARLATLLKTREKAIDAALDAAKEHFAVIGTHLKAIRDDELYKEDFETFEAYVAARWDYSRAYAYRLISAAKVIEDLSTRVDTPPTTEKQTFAVQQSSSDPDVQGEVWTAAQEITGKEQPSAPEVRQVTAKVISKTRSVSDILAEQKAKNQPTEETVAVDDAIEACEKNAKRLANLLQGVRAAFKAKASECVDMSTMTGSLERKLKSVEDDLTDLTANLALLTKTWNGNRKQLDDLA